jgi:hypothetical protein
VLHPSIVLAAGYRGAFILCDGTVDLSSTNTKSEPLDMMGRETTETAANLSNGQEVRGQAVSHNGEAALRQRLKQLGHRNWVVIADSAYPLHSSAGVETVVAGCGHLDAVSEVLNHIHLAAHVSPSVYLDCELPFVSEEDAPGAREFRENLARLVSLCNRVELLHEEIIAKLHDAAERFRVLVIKTNGTIPYTSVFIELQCRYWSINSENRLRSMMEKVAPASHSGPDSQS